MNSAFANVKTITKRELTAYFASPVAYVFIVIFLLLCGFFTFMLGGFFERREASLTSFFLWHPWLYLFLVPAVGMRLSAGTVTGNDVKSAAVLAMLSVTRKPPLIRRK